jgi:hypothetical protein
VVSAASPGAAIAAASPAPARGGLAAR